MLKKILGVENIPKQVKEIVKSVLPIISMAMAFGLLYYQKIPEPLLPAIIIGLTACGGFDLLKQKKNSTQPDS